METSLLLIVLSIVALIFAVAYTNNTILVVSIAGFIIILLLFYFSKSDKYISGIRNAQEEISLSLSDITGDSAVVTRLFTHSIWFYIRDFSDNAATAPAPLLESKQVNISFDRTGELDIVVSPDSTNASSSACTVYPYPLQTWVNLIVSRHQNTLDVYLDGKLVRTCHIDKTLDAGALTSAEAVTLTPRGGFVGQTANYLYINGSINPQRAYEIYRDGAGGDNMFSNLLSKYKLKISYLVDNIEQKSLTI